METIKRKSGTKYREMIRINGQVIKSPLFGRKTDARNWKYKIETERERGLDTESYFHSNILFEDFSKIWIEKKVKLRNSPRTLENYQGDLKNHIIPLISKVPLAKINPNLANELIQRMKAKSRSPRTINKVLVLLKTILNDAVKWNYLVKNPLFSFPGLKEIPRKDRFLSKFEINQLLTANFGDRIYPLLVTALNTGMRIGEILGLCWDRVDLNSGHLEVTRSMSRLGLKETTKTNKKRYIPIHDELKALLLELSEQNMIRYQSRFVFLGKNGLPLDINHVSQREFKKALKRAGIDEQVRFHDLRHTYASHFMMNGGDLFLLQKILGHAQIEMTQRYAHFGQNYLREAVKVVNFMGQENLENIPKKKEIFESEPVLNHKVKILRRRFLEAQSESAFRKLVEENGGG